jgi:hypothetical protein
MILFLIAPHQLKQRERERAREGKNLEKYYRGMPPPYSPCYAYVEIVMNT